MKVPRVLKVFVGSPDDVAEERNGLAKLLADINDVLAYLTPEKGPSSARARTLRRAGSPKTPSGFTEDSLKELGQRLRPVFQSKDAEQAPVGGYVESGGLLT